MAKLKVQRPMFPREVVLESLSNMDADVREFLEYHATKPLEEIGLEDTNQFLQDAYYSYVHR